MPTNGTPSLSFGQLFFRCTGHGLGISGLVLILDFLCRSETLTGAGLSLFQNLAWMLIFAALASTGWGLLAAVLGTVLSKLPGLKRFPAYRIAQFFSWALLVYFNLFYMRLYAVIMSYATMKQLSIFCMVAFPLALLLYPLILKHELAKTLEGAYAQVGKTAPFILAVAILITLFGGPQTAEKGDDDRPNIVMITIDSLSAHHMSLHGYDRETTPNLAKLAESSLVFDHCVSNSNGTHIGLPTFLGNRPFEPAIGAPDKPLLSRVLVANGYDSSFVSFKILDPYFRRTFHRTISLHEVESKPWYQASFGRFSSRKDDQIWLSGFLSEDSRSWRLFSTVKPREFDGAPGRAFPTEANLDYLLQALGQQGQPKFLWTHLFSVHYPRPTIPEYVNFFTGLPPESEGLNQEQQQAVNQYDSAIAEIDYHLGQFLEELEQRGLAENTMLIIGSDHGESLFYKEAGQVRYMHSGNWLNERVCRVPLLIKLPGQTKGERIQTFVQQFDVAPTVLDVLKIEAPKEWPGRSVLSFREHPQAYREEYLISVPESFFQRVFTRMTEAPSWNWVGFDADMMAIYKDPYKVGWIQFYNEDPQLGPGWWTDFKTVRIYGVYNLRQDPDLTNDLGATPEGQAIIREVSRSDLPLRYRFPRLNGELKKE